LAAEEMYSGTAAVWFSLRSWSVVCRRTRATLPSPSVALSLWVFNLEATLSPAWQATLEIASFALSLPPVVAVEDRPMFEALCRAFQFLSVTLANACTTAEQFAYPEFAYPCWNVSYVNLSRAPMSVSTR
jgi:hypothetical protein